MTSKMTNLLPGVICASSPSLIRLMATLTLCLSLGVMLNSYHSSVKALHVMFIGDSTSQQQYLSFAETIRYGNLPAEKAFPFLELSDHARLNARSLYQPSTASSPTSVSTTPPIIIKNLTPRALLMDNCSTKSAQVGNKALCNPEPVTSPVTTATNATVTPSKSDPVPDSTVTAPEFVLAAAAESDPEVTVTGSNETEEKQNREAILAKLEKLEEFKESAKWA